MDHVVFYEPRKRARRGRSSAEVEQDVMALLRGFPAGKEDWADGKPQSDEEVTDLFDQLTLVRVPRSDRAAMACNEVLQTFAQTVSPEDPLHVATLAAASVVGMRLGKLPRNMVQGIMQGRLDESPSMLDGKRIGVSRCILFLDILHSSKAFGGRTYELPLRRTSK